MPASTPPAALDDARDRFIAEWGGLGPAWGVSRTMSQIHALLMVSPESMNTDQIMGALEISRGNAHSNIQELCAWGLLRKLSRTGERKDYFEAEKDVWRVVQLILRERKRAEFEPALSTLSNCLESTKGLRDKESRAFRKQLKELQEFTSLADRLADRVARMESSTLLRWIARVLP
jgi:DNA-binding transcriptional regulator GbsR (MarR family)